MPFIFNSNLNYLIIQNFGYKKLNISLKKFFYICFEIKRCIKKFNYFITKTN